MSDHTVQPQCPRCGRGPGDYLPPVTDEMIERLMYEMAEVVPDFREQWDPDYFAERVRAALEVGQ